MAASARASAVAAAASAFSSRPASAASAFQLAAALQPRGRLAGPRLSIRGQPLGRRPSVRGRLRPPASRPDRPGAAPVPARSSRLQAPNAAAISTARAIAAGRGVGHFFHGGFLSGSRELVENWLKTGRKRPARTAGQRVTTSSRSRRPARHRWCGPAFSVRARGFGLYMAPQPHRRLQRLHLDPRLAQAALARQTVRRSPG